MNYEHAIEWLEAIDVGSDGGYWKGKIDRKALDNLFELGLVRWVVETDLNAPKEDFELSDYGRKMLTAARGLNAPLPPTNAN